MPGRSSSRAPRTRWPLRARAPERPATPRSSAATAPCSHRRGPARRPGGDRPARSRKSPGHDRRHAGAGPPGTQAGQAVSRAGCLAAAADRTAPQPDAADPAADRRSVLVRFLPAIGQHAADVGLPHVLEHGPGPRDHRLRAAGGRDGRVDRVAGWQAGTADLVTAAPRPRWPAQLASWAAAAAWAVGAYLVFVCVMFAVYAGQGVIGTPPWWWVAAGAAAVLAFSAAGFAVGAYWPSRFASPLAAFGAF